MNKDNKVLIYSTHAISSIYSKLLVEQMNIVENFKQFSEDEWTNKLNHCKNVFMQIKDFSIKGL